MNQTEIDRAIMAQLVQYPELPQADVVKSVLTFTSEPQAYVRIRKMMVLGLLTKTGHGNRKTLALTEAGRALAEGV